MRPIYVLHLGAVEVFDAKEVLETTEEIKREGQKGRLSAVGHA
jgi:hypothetical protein